ncbi:toluene ABC transporter periplasmic protein [Neokomagataea thailandica NBRC 106555]|uniref:Toluene ABC transporter periplasmic protein n=1 Tax=Neokomagataea thailandica NBRC 106555 TaxID=1223520 RepID=A0ABQ0QN94_9PROT|nr:toluene ABC transporter periplasmic protein [Neokomagataea thailandica NBRC 106555]
MLVLLVVLLGFAVVGNRTRRDEGYPVHAAFSQIDGLDVGSDVRLAGITVGHVTAETVDPKTFQAQVTFNVAPNIKLPVDTAAIITSDSLLGGKYIALSPGGSDHNVQANGVMTETQGSISLEQLLSKFIFSVTDTLQKAKSADKAPNSSTDTQPHGGLSDQP